MERRGPVSRLLWVDLFAYTYIFGVYVLLVCVCAFLCKVECFVLVLCMELNLFVVIHRLLCAGILMQLIVCSQQTFIVTSMNVIGSQVYE